MSSEQDEVDDLIAKEMDQETIELMHTLIRQGHKPDVVDDFIKMYVMGMPGLGIDIFIVNGHECSGIITMTDGGARLLFLRPPPGLEITHRDSGLRGSMSRRAEEDAAKKLN